MLQVVCTHYTPSQKRKSIKAGSSLPWSEPAQLISVQSENQSMHLQRYLCCNYQPRRDNAPASAREPATSFLEMTIDQ